MKTRYNIYISTQLDKFNLLVLNEDKLNVVINSYLGGKDNFTISGVKYSIKRLVVIKIFTHTVTFSAYDLMRYCVNKNLAKRNKTKYYIPPKSLVLFGKDITYKKIENKEFGENVVRVEQNGIFVNLNRIKELEKTSSSEFDLTKLIKLCNEINFNYEENNFLSVGILCRTILNHIPPIFGFRKFSEVANNYGTKSFKDSMSNLDNSMRKIADGFLHTTIRKKESLPNETQIDFRQALDVLIEEILRKLNE